MVKKIKLYSIGNWGDYNYYVFDKKKEIIKILGVIFSKVSKIDWDLYEYDISKKINLRKIKDYHETIGLDDDNRADIFYGDKKMFIIIYCSKKFRDKFNKEIGKVASMPKYKYKNKKS